MDEPQGAPLQIVIFEPRPAMGEIRIVGSVDASNVKKLKAALEELFQKRVYKVVVNLVETKYIASSGFGCFLISLDTVRENGGQIIFASTPTGIRRIFDILGLSEVLHFSDDVDSALDQLGR